MNNIRETRGYFLDDFRKATPKLVLNADVHDDGVVIKREGYDQNIALTNCHSVWPTAGATGSVMLCVADYSNVPYLYRINDGVATRIGEVWGNAPYSYEEVADHVYLSNGYYHGVYDIINGTLRGWGLSLPDLPEVEPIEGELPEGEYKLCYTTYDSTRSATLGANLGGTSNILRMSWSGGTLGIKLLNRPTDALCWLTEPNGDTLFLASPNSSDEITTQPTLQALPTLLAKAPEALYPLHYAFGRMWGARAGTLHYSDEFRPEWFRDANTMPFMEDILMIASTEAGLYVASSENTWILDGREPAKMVKRRLGDGMIQGTLIYAIIEGGGFEISKEDTKWLCPVWLSKKGWVVGTHNGHLVYLTEAKLNMAPIGPAAALWRKVDGLPQFIVSLPQASNLSGDHAAILAAGKL